MKNKSEQSSTFFNGLLIGFLAGATSYLLVKTEEGQQLKESFKNRWQQAKQDLPQLTEIKLGEISLEEVLDIVLGNQSVSDLQKLEKKPLIKKVSRQKKEKSKPAQFKGV